MITDKKRAQVAARARSAVGKPYVLNTAGPDTFDCSGLVVWAWEPYLTLPHNSTMLATDECLPDNIDLLPARKKVDGVWPRNLLLPGDYVMDYGKFIDPSTISHVALYVGDGLMVNATNEARGVELIEINAYAKPVGYGLVR